MYCVYRTVLDLVVVGGKWRKNIGGRDNQPRARYGSRHAIKYSTIPSHDTYTYNSGSESPPNRRESRYFFARHRAFIISASWGERETEPAGLSSEPTSLLQSRHRSTRTHLRQGNEPGQEAGSRRGRGRGAHGCAMRTRARDVLGKCQGFWRPPAARAGRRTVIVRRGGGGPDRRDGERQLLFPLLLVVVVILAVAVGHKTDVWRR